MFPDALPVSVAPMMDWTDRHCRYFLRLISHHARLYTEMITTGALIHGDADRHLAFSPAEQPVALQLGGSDPDDLARCAAMGEAAGYAEINLNVGCPSDRVQSGRFGACLMAEPQTVAACVAAMRRAVTVPVTVKSRIGIDHQAGYDHLQRFVATVAEAGCEVFIVHARKAWLQGLSPRENREIPPLRYDHVYRLKQDLPGLTLVINGGIHDLDAATGHLERVDGVMLGRAAYQNPWLLAGVDRRLFDDPRTPPERAAVLAAYLDYARERLADGAPQRALTRHILGLMNGLHGAKRYRQMLSAADLSPHGSEALETALDWLVGTQARRAGNG